MLDGYRTDVKKHYNNTQNANEHNFNKQYFSAMHSLF